MWPSIWCRESQPPTSIAQQMLNVSGKKRRTGGNSGHSLTSCVGGEQEAMLFLRNRRRGLSLQHCGAIREAVEASPHRLIFPRVEE